MSEQAKHTPGSWVVTPGRVSEIDGHLFVRQGPPEYGVYGPFVCHVHPQDSPDDGRRLYPDATCAANARLIAAAPDLLDELTETAAWLDDRANVLVQLLADPKGWGRGQAVTDKRQAIREEIARLQGRAFLVRQVIQQATTQGA